MQLCELGGFEKRGKDMFLDGLSVELGLELDLIFWKKHNNNVDISVLKSLIMICDLRQTDCNVHSFETSLMKNPKNNFIFYIL